MNHKTTNRAAWIAAFLCLAVLVTAGVARTFHLTGIAKTYQAVLTCTAEPTHGPGYADFFVHTHNEDCYDENGTLWCQLEEIEAHVHDESCYTTTSELICTTPESDGHQHTEACYTRVRGELTCGLEESEPVLDEEGNVVEEGHVHTDECYLWSEEFTCGMAEGEGAHHHDDACYQSVTKLTCDKPVVVLHTHGEDCYTEDEDGNLQLTCGMLEVTEHVHTVDCFTVYETDDGETEETEEYTDTVANDTVSEDQTAASNGEGNTEDGESGLVFLFPEEENEDGESALEDMQETDDAEDTDEADSDEKGETEDTENADPESNADADKQDGTKEDTQNTETTVNADMPAQTFSGETEEVSVNVVAPEGAFPAGTTMEVKTVEIDDETMSSVESAVEGRVTSVQAVDITFYDADGNKIEPQTAIQVSMKSAVVSESENVSLMHKPDAVETEETGTETPALEVVEAAIVEQNDTAVPSDEIIFESDSFSTYYIVGSETITTKYITADGETYAITLTYGPEANIPDGAELNVVEIPADSTEYENYRSMSEQGLEKDSRLTFARFFDITILKDGEEVQPQAAVEVTIEKLEELKDEKTDDVKAVHFVTENSFQMIDTTSTEEAVTFEANGFSVYSILGTELVTEITLPGSDDTYEVTVTYGPEAMIPDNVSLDVTSYAYGSAEYNRAREAILTVKKSVDHDYDESTLGFKALDISIIDEYGNRVEPAEGAEVKVTFRIKELPAGTSENQLAQSLEIQHLNESAGQTIVETVAGVADVTVANGTVEAKFTLDSFSTFTLTWGDNDSATIHWGTFDDATDTFNDFTAENMNAFLDTSASTVSVANTFDGYSYYGCGYKTTGLNESITMTSDVLSKQEDGTWTIKA